MTQSAIVGLPGSGKSYFATELALKAIKSGRHVITNLPLSVQSDLILPFDWSFFETDREEGERVEYPAGALYLFDEAWRGFPAGTKIKDLSEFTLSFFKEHRHRKNEKGITDDIILITQDLSDITATIRNLTAQTILCEKPTSIGLNNVSVRYYHSGALKGTVSVKSSFLRSEQVKLSPDVYNNYTSHTISEASDGSGKIVEGSAVDTSIWKSFKAKFWGFILVFTLITGAYSFYHTATVVVPKYKGETPSELNPSSLNPSIQSSEPVKTVSSEPVLPPVPLPPPPSDSKIWRVSAYVKNVFDGSVLVYAQNQYHQFRKIDFSFCKLDDFSGVICTVDNEIISEFTGSHDELKATPLTGAFVHALN